MSFESIFVIVYCIIFLLSLMLFFLIVFGCGTKQHIIPAVELNHRLRQAPPIKKSKPPSEILATGLLTTILLYLSLTVNS